MATRGVMAHRGGRAGDDPNTIEAIDHACDVGAASVEIDVNTTADGVLLATHDSTLADRTWISDVSIAQLEAADGQAWAHRRLYDVVEHALSRGVVVYLDIKSITPAGLAHVTSAWPAAVNDEQIIFAAARGDVLAWIGRQHPEASTSFLYYDPSLDLRSLGPFQQPRYIHPCFDFVPGVFDLVDEHFVERARSLGFGLVSWSENDPSSIERLAGLGFDLVCSDETQLAVAAIERGR